MRLFVFTFKEGTVSPESPAEDQLALSDVLAKAPPLEPHPVPPVPLKLP